MSKIIWSKLDLEKLKQVYQLSDQEIEALKDDSKASLSSVSFLDPLKIKVTLAKLKAINPMVLLKTKEGWSQVKIQDIYYLESFKDEIIVHTKDQSLTVIEPLYQLETLLTPYHFARVAKSYVVNISRIVNIKTSLNAKLSLTLDNGQLVDVTRSYVSAFKKILEL